MNSAQQPSENIKSFDPDDLIIIEGATARCAYLIRSGHVRIFHTGDKGEEVEITKIGPGQIFGEMALISEHKKHAASAEAVTKVTAVPIPITMIDSKLEKTDPLIKTILTSLVGRLYRETFLRMK